MASCMVCKTGMAVPRAVHIDHEGFPSPIRRSSWVRARQYLGFFVLAISVVFVGTIPFATISPLLVVALSWYPRATLLFTNWAIGCWLIMTSFLIGKCKYFTNTMVTTADVETCFNINVRMFGDVGEFGDRCLLLMNHRTHLDWLFLWSVVSRYGNLYCWKAVMKSSLKHIPLYGWALQYGLHVFINRVWSDDQTELQSKLQIYNTYDLPLQLLLFPGGGDLTLKTKSCSDSYADSKGYPHYNYVLHPRLRGFLYTVNKLRSHRLDTIVDITVAYPDALPKTELHFVRGHVPIEVHYYIRRFPLKGIPQSDEALADWIKKIWAEKEDRLKYFYTHRKFPDNSENYRSILQRAGFYHTVLFFTLINYFIYSMFSYCFYTTLLYFALSLLWLVHKIQKHGAIDKLLLSSLYIKPDQDHTCL
ncbi:lysocardiolipin acyltransferase 1-like isoform X3 [Dysidea avara]|uniref:lysocardiolipin acyltransferase 1-like isoform X3 n=1 Tax=Dysidea avara TaxID=196820 RepID=UPI003327E028